MSVPGNLPTGGFNTEGYENVPLDDESSKLPSIKPGAPSTFENFGQEARDALNEKGTVYINPSSREVNEGLVKEFSANGQAWAAGCC